MSEWGKRLDDLETPIEYYRVDAKNWDRCVVGEARSLACTIYHLIQKRVRLLCDAYKRLGFAQC